MGNNGDQSRSSTLVCREKKRKLVLQRGCHSWLLDLWNKCLLNILNAQTQAEQDALLCMLGYDGLMGRSSAVSEKLPLWKGKHIETAQETFLRKIKDAGEYGMAWWRACVEIE